MHHDDASEAIATFLMFSPLEAFSSASLLVKLLLIIIMGAGLIAIVAAVMRKVSGGPRSALLGIMGQVGLYAGIAGAGYQGTATYLTAQAMHVTRFVVFEPEVIEAVYVLLLGVVVWLIARLGNAGAKRNYSAFRKV